MPQITEAKPTAGLYAPENRLNEHEAAKYLKRPVSTLRHWRVKGGGPDYLKVGRRIEYLIPHLDKFLTGALRSSTSDLGQAA